MLVSKNAGKKDKCLKCWAACLYRMEALPRAGKWSGSRFDKNPGSRSTIHKCSFSPFHFNDFSPAHIRVSGDLFYTIDVTFFSI
jgi:hypothetical protein